MIIVLGVDVSRETVGAVSHTNRDIFSFIFLYSHYIHQIMDRQYHQLSDLLGQRQQYILPVNVTMTCPFSITVSIFIIIPSLFQSIYVDFPMIITKQQKAF